MVSGVAATIAFGVWDTVESAWQTGDAANLTLRLMADGTVSTPSGTPAEIDGANAPGQYRLALTAAENTGTSMLLVGKSGTANCIVIPVAWDNLDATISSRSTYAGADTAGTTTLLTRLSAARATAIDTIAADVVGLDGATMYDPAGTGANTVTITVRTAGGVVYEGIRVSATNAAETASPLVQYTDSSGQVTYHLDAGSWRIIAATTAAQSGGHTDVTVDGAESVTVTVTAVALPTPTAEDTWALWNRENKLEGEIPFGAGEMTIRVVAVDAAGRNDAVGLASRALVGTEYQTDATGRWTFEIAQALDGSQLTIEKTWTGEDDLGHSEKWQALVDKEQAEDDGTLSWAALSPRLLRS